MFVWTMGWVVVYLNRPIAARRYSWVIIIVLGFETLYIALQASRGQLSHFKVDNRFSETMYQLMGVAILVLTLWTAWIGYRFFKLSPSTLPAGYLWGIRMGIVLFVVFALEGVIMAILLRHTVGAADGGPGLPLINWSTRHGDLRVAHFAGMHALQLLPLAGCYVARSKTAIILLSLMYFAVVTLLLVQALAGQSLVALPSFQ